MFKFGCRILKRHIPIDIDYEKRTAVCASCGKFLEVVYDMSYGDTVVVKEIK